MRGFRDGNGSVARFWSPVGLVVIGRESYVYVCDGPNNRLRLITLPSHIFDQQTLKS